MTCLFPRGEKGGGKEDVWLVCHTHTCTYMYTYSGTSEERTIWDRAFCPLLRGCPLLEVNPFSHKIPLIYYMPSILHKCTMMVTTLHDFLTPQAQKIYILQETERNCSKSMAWFERRTTH